MVTCGAGRLHNFNVNLHFSFTWKVQRTRWFHINGWLLPTVSFVKLLLLLLPVCHWARHKNGHEIVVGREWKWWQKMDNITHLTFTTTHSSLIQIAIYADLLARSTIETRWLTLCGAFFPLGGKVTQTDKDWLWVGKTVVSHANISFFAASQKDGFLLGKKCSCGTSNHCLNSPVGPFGQLDLWQFFWLVGRKYMIMIKFIKFISSPLRLLRINHDEILVGWNCGSGIC